MPVSSHSELFALGRSAREPVPSDVLEQNLDHDRHGLYASRAALEYASARRAAFNEVLASAGVIRRKELISVLERRLSASVRLKVYNSSPKVAFLLWASVGCSLLSRLWIDNILYRIMCFPEIGQDALATIISSQYQIEGARHFFLSGILSTALSFLIFYRRWNGRRLADKLDRFIWASVSKLKYRDLYTSSRPFIQSSLNVVTWAVAYSAHLWHVQVIMGKSPSLTGWLHRPDGLFTSVYKTSLVHQVGMKLAIPLLALDSCAYTAFYPSIPFRAFQEVQEVEIDRLGAEMAVEHPDYSESSDSSSVAAENFRFSSIASFFPNPFYSSPENTTDAAEHFEPAVKGTRGIVFRNLTLASALIRLSGVPLQYYLVRSIFAHAGRIGSLSTNPLFLRYGPSSPQSGSSWGLVNKILLCQGLGLACQLAVGGSVFWVGEHLMALLSV